MKNVFRLLVLQLITTGIFAQDGPGGLGSPKMASGANNKLLFWYRASDIVASNGTMITQWPAAGNFGGTVPNLVLGTAGSQPRFYDGSTGGFDGNSQIPYVSIPQGQSLVQNVAVGAGYTMYIVARPVTSAAAGSFKIFKLSNSAGEGLSIGMNSASDGTLSHVFTESRSLNGSSCSNNTQTSNAIGGAGIRAVTHTFMHKISTGEVRFDYWRNDLAVSGGAGQNNEFECTHADNDLIQLTIGDPGNTLYTALQVAEVFAFKNVTEGYESQIKDYLFYKYNDAHLTDAYRYDYVRLLTTSSGFRVVSSGLELNSVSGYTNEPIGTIELSNNLNGPTQSFSTSATYPYLKVSNREWQIKVVREYPINEVQLKLSFDQGILSGATSGIRKPILVVKRGSQTLFYDMVFVSKIPPENSTYEFTETAETMLATGDKISIAYYEHNTCSITGGTSMYLSWGNQGTLPETSTSTTGLTVKKNASTSGNGVLHFYKASIGLDNAPQTIASTYFRPFNEDWCVTKLGDANQTFDVVLDPSQYALPSGYTSYVLLIDGTANGYLNNANDQVIYLRKNATGLWEARGINIPNGARVKVGVDMVNTVSNESTADDFSPLVATYNNLGFTAAGINNSIISGILDGAHASIVSTNVANITHFNRFWVATSNKKVEFSISKAKITELLNSSLTLQPWHQVVLLETTAGGSPIFTASKVYAATEENGILKYSLQLTSGKYYTFGVLNKALASLSATHVQLGAVGKIDAGYAVDKLDLNNTLRVYANNIGLYSHVVLYQTISGNNSLAAAEALNGLAYQRISRSYRIESFNPTGVGSLNYMFYADDLPTLPTGYSYVLISDANGTWGSNDTDRKITGLVKQGKHYYAYGQTTTDKYFTIGVALNAITEAKLTDIIIKEAVNNGLSQSPGTIANLVINEKKKFDYASPCSTQVAKNILKITLSTGKDYLFGLLPNGSPSNFTLTLGYKLRYLDAGGVLIGTEEVKSLDLSTAYPEAMFSKVLPTGTNKVQVEVVPFTAATIADGQTDAAKLKNALELRAEIIQDVKYYVPQTRDNSIINNPGVINEDKKPVTFTWATDQCPVAGYKFQLLRLYNTDAEKTTQELISTDVDWSKALTLDVPTNQVVLQLAEGTGFYTWRVQPLGSVYDGGIANSDNWGKWSTENVAIASPVDLDKGTILTQYNNYVFFHNQLEDDKNFIYNRVFTEDGKIHESFSLANGILQGKQSQSKLNSNTGTTNEQGSLVISQSIYDYNGRPAISTLPAPVINSDNSVSSQDFGFKPDFMKDNNGQAFGPRNIDYVPGTTGSQPLKNEPVGRSHLNDYYSDFNSDQQIPSAQGYPYTRVIYSVDGNNDVIEQGGVGIDHQPGIGKTVRSITSTASSDELLALFGNETPEENSIYRNSITDQNGVTSLTYTNKSGKTIATCLVFVDTTASPDGNPNYPMKLLPSAKAKYSTTGEILKKTSSFDIKDNAFQGDLIVSYKDIDLVGNTPVTVDYSFTQKIYGSDICGKYCVSCGYDLDISIMDLDKNAEVAIGTFSTATDGNLEPLVENVPQGQDLNAYVAGKTPKTLNLINWTLKSTGVTANGKIITLPAGKFRIIKVLRPRKDGPSEVANKMSQQMQAEVKEKIINPLKAALQRDLIRGVNKLLVETVYGSSSPAVYGMIDGDFSTSSFGIALSIRDEEGQIVYQKGVSGTKPAFDGIKNGQYLWITTSCCEMKVPLYAYEEDPCSPRTYLTVAEFNDDGIDNIKQVYDINGSPSQGTGKYYEQMEDKVSQYLVNYAVDQIHKSKGSSYGFSDLTLDETITYSEAEFKSLVKNMLYDNILWKQDSILNFNDPVALNKSAYRKFQGYTCDAIVDNFKAVVLRKYTAGTVKSPSDVVNASPSSAGQIPNVGDGALNGKVPNNPIINYLDMLGRKYVGYVESTDNGIKTVSYKLFNYPRSSQNALVKNKRIICESAFCMPTGNEGKEIIKDKCGNEHALSDNQLDGLDLAWPDLADPNVKTSICSAGMITATMEEKCEIQSEPANTYIDGTASGYNRLKVKVLGSSPVAYRYLTTIDYASLKSCFESVGDDIPMLDQAENTSTQFDDLSRADSDERIKALNKDLQDKGIAACGAKYDAFVAKLKELYKDGNGYKVTTKNVLGANLVVNGDFEGSGCDWGWSIPQTSQYVNKGYFTYPDYGGNMTHDAIQLKTNTTYRFSFKYKKGTISSNSLKFNIPKDGSAMNISSNSYVEYFTLINTSLAEQVISLDFNSGDVTNLSFGISTDYFHGQVDDISIREITTATAALTESDICCTAQSLIENCKNDAKLDLQYVDCPALNTMSVNYYYKSAVDPLWKTAPNIKFANVEKTSFSNNGNELKNGSFNLVVNAKHYKRLQTQMAFVFSDGSKATVDWTRTLGANEQRKTIRIKPRIVGEQLIYNVKEYGDDDALVGDPNGTDYTMDKKVPDLLANLKAAEGKLTGPCDNPTEAPAITLTNVELIYCYEDRRLDPSNYVGKINYGVASNVPQFPSNDNSVQAISMVDQVPDVDVQLKARFIYSDATASTGKYYESCISKFELKGSDLVSGSNTLTPVGQLVYNSSNQVIGFKMVLRGTSKTFEASNRDPEGMANTCINKDMFVTKELNRRTLVAPGTAQQMANVNAIINGNFDLNIPSTSPAENATFQSQGFRLKPVAERDYTSCQTETHSWRKTLSRTWGSSNREWIGKWSGAANNYEPYYFTQQKGELFYIMVNEFRSSDNFYLGTRLIVHDQIGKTFINKTFQLSLPIKGFIVDESNKIITFSHSSSELILDKIENFELTFEGGVYAFGSTLDVDNDGIGDETIQGVNYNDIVISSISAKSLELVGDIRTSYGLYAFIVHIGYDLYSNNSYTIDGINLMHPSNLSQEYLGDLPNSFSQIKIKNGKQYIVSRKTSFPSIHTTIPMFCKIDPLSNTSFISYVKGVSSMIRDFIVDDQGKVITLQNISMPSLLRSQFKIVKLDENGEEFYSKEIISAKYSSNEGYGNINFTPNKDGYIIGAMLDRSSFLPNSNEGGKEIWICVTDLEGNILFEEIIGGSGDEMSPTVTYSSDGGIMIHALSNSPCSENSDKSSPLIGDYDVWMTKLMKVGEITPCAPQAVYLKWIENPFPPCVPEPCELTNTCPCTNPSICPPPTCTNPDECEPPSGVSAIVHEALNYAFGECEEKNLQMVKDLYTNQCHYTTDADQGNKNPIKESFKVSYGYATHHHTLYYYDRAGQLIKTVPPEGVEFLNLPITPLGNDPTDAEKAVYAAQVQAFRNTSPPHRLVTTYRYNSLGQLKEQNTPDGGTTVFAYDRLGKLRFSQSARQKAMSPQRFSYTKYDYLVRITEAGEAELGLGQTFTDVIAQVESASYPTTGKKEYTNTVYSTPVNNVVDFYGKQRNLLNRVSYVYASGSDGRKVMTYYSYDVHGNVEWLVQDIPGFSQYHIGYEYDLVSNKVLKVKFNAGRPDAFYHKYSYDADNRITAVYTSRDNELWDKDASYEYYKHGPLRRTVIGEDRIQGLDYTYTIHGWLKAINGIKPQAVSKGSSAEPKSTTDPGNDGIETNALVGVSTDKSTALDEWAMALQYYAGDFQKTGSMFNSGTGAQGNIMPSGTQNPTSNTQNLYNGNITAWLTRIPQEYRDSDASTENNKPKFTGSQYTYTQTFKYDELNRIAESKAWKFSSNGDFTATEDYGTAYKYDANGNILALARQGFVRPNSTTPTAQEEDLKMDKFVYAYNTNANDKLVNNKLRGVSDAIVGDIYTEDLSSQGNFPKESPDPDNYEYDAVGNLIKDKQEGLTITWNAYGKVDQVNKDLGSGQVRTIKYAYDATGNRISKEVYKVGVNGSITRESFLAYVRDAQGNTMSVYDKKLFTAPSYGHTTVTFTQKETYLYGSSRLGVYYPNKEVGNIYVLDEGLNKGYSYKDVKNTYGDPEVIAPGYYQSKINNKNYHYLSLDKHQYNSNTGNYESAGNVQKLLPARMDRSVFQGLNASGNQVFYGFTAKQYFNKSNVVLLFGTNHKLMANSQGLLGDAAASPVVLRQGTTNKYILVTRGTDQKLYYHIIDATTGVLSKNLPVGTEASYGASMTALSNQVGGYHMVYTTRYQEGNLKLMGIRFDYNTTTGVCTPREYEMYTLATECERAEVKVEQEHNRLVLVTYQGRLGWFGGMRKPSYKSFALGHDFRIADIDGTPPQVIDEDFYVGTPSFQFEPDGVQQDRSPVSIYESYYKNTVSNNYYHGRRYTGPVSSTHLSLGVDQVLYLHDQDGASKGLMPINPYAYVLNSEKNGPGMWTVPGGIAKPYAYQPVQVLNIYTKDNASEHFFARHTGAKAYELSDHLGNVSVTLSDLKYKAQGEKRQYLGGNLMPTYESTGDVEISSNEVGVNADESTNNSSLKLNLGKAKPGVQYSVTLTGTAGRIPVDMSDPRTEVRIFIGSTQGQTYSYDGTTTYTVINEGITEEDLYAELIVTNLNAGIYITGITVEEVGNLRAQVLGYTSYYAFGMAMPGRTKQGDGYRYGFNGQEKSDEIAPGHTTALFWEYDSRTGRRWNMDPVKDHSESSYVTNKDNPLKLNDPNGDCSTCKTEIKAALGVVWGNRKQGVSLKLSITQNVGSLTVSGGIGATLYRKFYTTERRGLELRGSIKGGYDDGNNSVTLGTNWWQGLGQMKQFAQRTGTLQIKVGKFSAAYENDGFPFAINQSWGRFLADGDDSHRTAAVTVGWDPFKIGFNLLTGKRSSYEYDPDKIALGNVKGKFGENYPYGYVEEEYTTRQYRVGLLWGSVDANSYGGFGTAKIGIDSDRWVRHPIQNGFAHNTHWTKQPGFLTKSDDIMGYYQGSGFYGNSGFSLYEE